MPDVSGDTVGLHVLLSTVSSDSHTWNLAYLEMFCAERGHRVENLGACVPDEQLIERAMAGAPDLVVLSSVNGHGRIDGERLIRRLRAHPELAGLPVVIGGKLGVAGRLSADEVSALRAAGFTAVFQDEDMSSFERLLDSLAAHDGSNELVR